MKYEQVFIYFDTNALECRHSGKALFLSKIALNQLFYNVIKLVTDFKLDNKVEICIPEIVWLEIKKHMISFYENQKNSLTTKVNEYRKTFGDLVELEYNFKLDKEYESFFDELEKDFWNDPKNKAQIIACPKSPELVDKIIHKAMYTEKPFVTARNNKKEYTDAGLKDALIPETIITHSKGAMGIVVSEDSDFDDAYIKEHFPNIIKCSDEDEIKIALFDNFGIHTNEEFRVLLEGNDYLLDRIICDANLHDVNEYAFDRIVNISEAAIGEKVEFLMYINQEKFFFAIEYDIDANELLNANAEIYDESEE